MSILNNPIVNWFLKYALSKGGIVVRLLVGYVIAAVAARHIVPDGDLLKIQHGLESGGYALLALAYAFFQYWINQRSKRGAKVVQEAVNINLVKDGLPPVRVDGIIGNQTLRGALYVHPAITQTAIARVATARATRWLRWRQ